MEQFAEILDITIINLKDNGNCGDLGDGSLYLTLQKKLPEMMQTQYQRWIYEKRRRPFVEASEGVGNNEVRISNDGS